MSLSLSLFKQLKLKEEDRYKRLQMEFWSNKLCPLVKSIVSGVPLAEPTAAGGRWCLPGFKLFNLLVDEFVRQTYILSGVGRLRRLTAADGLPPPPVQDASGSFGTSSGS